eukprot:UN25077
MDVVELFEYIEEKKKIFEEEMKILVFNNKYVKDIPESVNERKNGKIEKLSGKIKKKIICEEEKVRRAMIHGYYFEGSGEKKVLKKIKKLELKNVNNIICSTILPNGDGIDGVVPDGAKRKLWSLKELVDLFQNKDKLVDQWLNPKPPMDDFEHGEVNVCLTGGSGTGKSSLIKSVI